jgi:hypothetical protein
VINFNNNLLSILDSLKITSKMKYGDSNEFSFASLWACFLNEFLSYSNIPTTNLKISSNSLGNLAETDFK